MAHPRTIAIAALVAASCASAPAPAPPAAAPVATAPPRAAVGMDGAALRHAWGDPSSTRRIPSPAAPGLTYERWTWGKPGEGREAVLVDDRVIDLLDPAPRGAGGG